ncbi:cathepsin B-like peptidase (C01 family) [Schistosoma mansoni]|uniref:cathepsin B-like peptidase (C01 family) n=1 Tax=Schistosoma mansoni TaxID=6183 RepID=UPI00019B38B7|nr:cathepsin B-like peptidase (C01 family) [Schistosoma mansoni]|eukprot:XP_018647485.1 cathepsin B-like peptidase (C01 family) [Schistosoma mansoni]
MTSPDRYSTMTIVAYTLCFTVSSILTSNRKEEEHKPNAVWKAEKSNRFHSLDDARIQMGARREESDLRRKKKWPGCKSIATIRDQSRCGSSWAFGAVEAMSDRSCIQSGGKQNVELSAVDLLSCCEHCGDGFEGGFPALAWDYWVKEGIVTGSSKENHTVCQPYPFPKCEHHTKGKYPACGEEIYRTPNCENTCQKSY